MITVEKTIKSNNEQRKTVNAVNEELLKTGKIKAKSQSYLPWVLLGLAAVAAAVWLWRKGKQENGAVSD